MERVSAKPFVPPDALKSLPFYGDLLEINGIKAHVVEKGKGFPIILIHGFTSCLYTWRKNIDALSSRFKVVTVDMPGFGFSDKPLDFPYNYSGFNDFFDGLMGCLKIKEAHFIGHSFGGGVCQYFALRNPHKVKSIVLVSPINLKNNSKINLYTKAFQNLLLYAYHDKSSISGEMLELFQQINKTPNAEAIRKRLLENMNHHSTDGPCFNHKHSCLVFWGMNDAILSPKNAFEIKKIFRNVDVKLLKNCGHMPHEERFEEFNGAVLDFFLGGGKENPSG